MTLCVVVGSLIDFCTSRDPVFCLDDIQYGVVVFARVNQDNATAFLFYEMESLHEVGTTNAVCRRMSHIIVRIFAVRLGSSTPCMSVQLSVKY